MNVENCTMDIDIDTDKEYSAGFVGKNSGRLSFSGCMSKVTSIPQRSLRQDLWQRQALHVIYQRYIRRTGLPGFQSTGFKLLPESGGENYLDDTIIKARKALIK